MARHKNRIRSSSHSFWVSVGKSFADLEKPAIAEMLNLRAAQGEHSQLHPYRNVANELPGIIFQPPARDRYKFRERYPLLREAAILLTPPKKSTEQYA